MKTPKFTLAAILAAAFSLGSLQAQITTNSSSSSSSSSESKSVTIVTKNGVTTKTTKTTLNGVTKTTIETTDADGNTTTKTDNGNDKAVAAQPWLGVNVKEIPEDQRANMEIDGNQGVIVQAVAIDSPAKAVEIEEGDILLSLGGSSVSSPAQLDKAISGYEVGDIAELKYVRDGEDKTVNITFTKRPANDDKADDNDKEDHGVEGYKGIEKMLNDPNIPADAKKMIRKMLEKMKANDNNTSEFSFSTTGGSIDDILNNPETPESFKERLKEMQKKMDGLK